MIASDAGASTTVASSVARELETWERLTISSSVPLSDSGYAPSGYEWVPQQADGTTRRDHSVPLLGADVDQTAGASGPGEGAPVVPSSSATAGGSASRLLPLPSAPAQAADEPDGVPDMPQRPAAHSGALQPPAASSSSSYEVIAPGGASETQEEQQQPAQPAQSVAADPPGEKAECKALAKQKTEQKADPKRRQKTAEIMGQVRKLGRYPKESALRSFEERQLALKTRRARKAKEFSLEDEAELQALQQALSC